MGAIRCNEAGGQVLDRPAALAIAVLGDDVIEIREMAGHA
jgi:hypothetical protein